MGGSFAPLRLKAWVAGALAPPPLAPPRLVLCLFLSFSFAAVFRVRGALAPFRPGSFPFLDFGVTALLGQSATYAEHYARSEAFSEGGKAFAPLRKGKRSKGLRNARGFRARRAKRAPVPLKPLTPRFARHARLEKSHQNFFWVAMRQT